MRYLLAGLIVLHGIDGREISVAPGHVTTLYASRGQNKLVAEGVTCVIGLSDGKTANVAETCAVVRQMLEPPPRSTQP